MKNEPSEIQNLSACHIPEQREALPANTHHDAEATIQFKTNLNCGSCVAKVAAALDATVGKGQWHVDTGSPDKILSIYNQDIIPAAVEKIISAAGYKSQIVNE